MSIRIAERLRPFSHTPGAMCALPGSFLIVQAFPTLLIVGEKRIPLPFSGPVKGFTLQQDLEKNCLYVFGRARTSYFRLRLWSEEGKAILLYEKGGKERIEVEDPFCSSKLASCERLSLGCHRAQDWDLVERRADLKEILPFLFFLGQKVPFIQAQELQGTAKLMQLPKERKELESSLLNWVKASFKSILVPRLMDDQHQGLVPDEEIKGNPFILLQEGFKMIRSLFFRQEERRLSFLPFLPISFDAGRMVGIKAEGIGTIDLEWSKKRIKKVIIQSSSEKEIFLDFPKNEKSFRLNRKERLDKEGPLLLKEKNTYCLDRFEK